MTGETMCYIGRKTCGCITAAMIDDEKTTAEQRTEFAKNMFDSGRSVERMKFDDAKNLLCRCQCVKGDCNAC